MAQSVFSFPDLSGQLPSILRIARGAWKVEEEEEEQEKEEEQEEVEEEEGEEKGGRISRTRYIERHES